LYTYQLGAAKHSYMLCVSGLHGLSCPPLHLLTSRDTSGEDRAPGQGGDGVAL